MAVEKAITFDDLQKDDDEDRIELRRGGRPGGRRGGRRGARAGGRRGSARGASRRGAKTRSRNRAVGRKKSARASSVRGTKTRRSKATQNKSISRRQQGQLGTPQKAKTAAAPSAAKKTTSGPSRKDRFKSTAQARKDIKNVEKRTREINRDFDNRTAFKTKSGDFLRDTKGNIVRSKTQVDRFKDDKRRQDIARKLGIDTTLGASAANPNLRSQQMTPGGFRLSNRLSDFKKSLGTGQQTPENLSRLVDINRQLGDFDYSGMGIGNQLRTQSADIAKGIPGLAKIGGAIAGGPMGLASLVATGGKGVLGFLKDKFSKGQETQTALAGEPEEGGLKGLLGKLRLGEGPAIGGGRPFDLVGRGPGGGGGQPMIPPPVMAPAPTVQQVAQQTPITSQPVDSRMLNQYLAMAGFSPEEISGLSEDTRYLG